MFHLLAGFGLLVRAPEPRISSPSTMTTALLRSRGFGFELLMPVAQRATTTRHCAPCQVSNERRRTESTMAKSSQFGDFLAPLDAFCKPPHITFGSLHCFCSWGVSGVAQIGEHIFQCLGSGRWQCTRGRGARTRASSNGGRSGGWQAAVRHDMVVTRRRRSSRDGGVE